MRYNSLEKNSSYSIFSNVNLKVKQRDFPGGPVIESPPAKAEDTGSICGLEDPTCHGATKPICHNHWACAPELEAATTKAHAPRAYALQ